MKASDAFRKPRPYRVVVFAEETQVVGKGKRARTVRSTYAYMGWTEAQYYSEARLPSAGSFLFPGLHAVHRAAMDYLAIPETVQVSVRTDQDRKVYVYFKNQDGTVSGYRPD